jgi:hypothetical protein
MNLAMGAKLLWRLITRNMAWWKHALWKNYFSGSRIRCTDYPLKTNSTLTIFKLVLAARPIISEELNWIPGNDKWIRPWEDEIMESDRLVHLAPLLPICKWLEAQGIASLSKLSSWSSNGFWLSWVNPRSPPPLTLILRVDLLLARMCPPPSKDQGHAWMGTSTIYSEQWVFLASRRDSQSTTVEHMDIHLAQQRDSQSSTFFVGSRHTRKSSPQKI